MQRAASNIRSLLARNTFPFSKDIFLSTQSPIRERVMSTPTWPVPYYQRVSKAYPIRGPFPLTQKTPSLTWEALTLQQANTPGSMLRTPSMRAQRADKLYTTPSSMSTPRVRERRLRLPDCKR